MQLHQYVTSQYQFIVLKGIGLPVGKSKWNNNVFPTINILNDTCAQDICILSSLVRLTAFCQVSSFATRATTFGGAVVRHISKYVLNDPKLQTTSAIYYQNRYTPSALLPDFTIISQVSVAKISAPSTNIHKTAVCIWVTIQPTPNLCDKIYIKWL